MAHAWQLVGVTRVLPGKHSEQLVPAALQKRQSVIAEEQGEQLVGDRQIESQHAEVPRPTEGVGEGGAVSGSNVCVAGR